MCGGKAGSGRKDQETHSLSLSCSPPRSVQRTVPQNKASDMSLNFSLSAGKYQIGQEKFVEIV